MTTTAKKTTTKAKPVVKAISNPELDLFLNMVSEAQLSVAKELAGRGIDPVTINHYTNRTLKRIVGASKWA